METNLDNYYEEGYKSAIVNARNQLQAAEALSKLNNYGLAVSILILASEEAVKAFSIYAKGLFKESPFPDYNKIFQSHDVKIEQIRGIVLFGELFKRMSDLVYFPIYLSLDGSSEEIEKTRNEGFKNFINWLNTDATSKYSNLHRQMKWWKHAKNLKEDGIYVRPNGKGWHLPEKIQRKTYQITYDYVSEIIDVVETFDEIDLKQPHFSELLRAIKLQMFSNR